MNDDDLRWLADHQPDSPEPASLTTDRARIALLEHAAAPRPRRGVRFARRAILLGATGAVAAGVVMTVTDPAKAPTRHHLGGQATIAQSPLIRLAARVTAAPAPPGDATLVVRHHTFPHAHDFWGYDLYEDGGTTFYGSTEAELRASMGGPENGNPKGGAVVRAAAASATDTPAAARDRVLAAAPPPHGQNGAIPAPERKAIRAKIGPGPTPTPASPRSIDDNYVWMNAMEAITAGAGRADVRAGAMQALSTIAAVTVRDATFDGNPVLEVTDTDFPDGYAETMVLDARTGVLVHFRGGTLGGAAGVDVTYDIRRVTLPGLEVARR